MSRNSSGTYTLAAGNPVVSGDIIEATWANSTLNDIASALTDSLSRSGQGGMSASLRLIDGSAATPAFAFTGEIGSGAYRAAAGDWYLTTLGQQVMRLQTTGASFPAGISGSITLNSGTANGVTYLNGSKVLTSGSNLTFDGTNFATTGSVTSAGASNSGNLAFTGTGNRITGDFSNATLANRVAFQTSTTNADTFPSFLPNGTSTSAGINIFNNSDPTNAGVAQFRAAPSEIRLAAAITGTGTYAPMTFYTGGSERMRIDTSGVVGIGVTPSAWDSAGQLQLAGTKSIAFSDSSGFLVANAYYNGGWKYIASQAATYYGQEAGIHRWMTAASGTAGNAISWSERMRIDSSGNVGIGVSSPNAKLDVSGVIMSRGGGGEGGQITLNNPDNTSEGMIVDVSAADTGRIFGVRNNFTLQIGQLAGTGGIVTVHTAGSERMRIDSSGNLLVGTTSQTNNAKVTVVSTDAAPGGIAISSSGSLYRQLYLASTGTVLNFWNGSNQASLTAAGVWTNASDARLKKDIIDIKYGLDTVLKSKPRSFNRVDVEQECIGFVAQELKPLIPEVVFGSDAEGDQYTVDYGSLVAVAFKAIQELSAQTTALKAELDATKAEVAALKAAAK